MGALLPWRAARGEELLGTLPIERLERLPLAATVKDAVFAVLVGLVDEDRYGTLTRERLEQELGRQKGRTRLPYRSLRELRRAPSATVPGETAQVTAIFDGPLSVSIPYTILWYHPGRLAASPSCVFREWSLGTVRLSAPLELRDVHVFALTGGRLRVDIDGWLDWLMGSGLDDTDVTGLLVFRYGGRRLGMAVGYNRNRRGRSGVFDFAEDKIVFPVPPELRTVGREMRARVETLLAGRPAGANNE